MLRLSTVFNRSLVSFTQSNLFLKGCTFRVKSSSHSDDDDKDINTTEFKEKVTDSTAKPFPNGVDFENLMKGFDPKNAIRLEDAEKALGIKFDDVVKAINTLAKNVNESAASEDFKQDEKFNMHPFEINLNEKEPSSSSSDTTEEKTFRVDKDLPTSSDTREGEGDKEFQTLVANPIFLLHLQDVNYTPKETISKLNEYIIGQEEGKKAVSIALRNRWRRLHLPSDYQDEVYPKNIIMSGPTGCGKTEICRRLAQIAHAPFVKCEATKYTEVGYYGKDVDTMVKYIVDTTLRGDRDLVESSLRLCKNRLTDIDNKTLNTIVNEKIISAFSKDNNFTYKLYKEALEKGELEDRVIPIRVPSKPKANRLSDMGNGVLVGMDIESLLNMNPKTVKTYKTVKEAREILKQQEIDKILSREDIEEEAIRLAQNNGIIFIDEIDKIIHTGDKHSSDASDEGVQRDLLPLVEGTTVNTKYGPINTKHILFIAAGAFHKLNVSDLLPELQGRFPIHVALKSLTEEDLYKILTETKYNLIDQQQKLLATENIQLSFTEGAIHSIAKYAATMNELNENIGARRLNTIIESITEEYSFNSSDYVNQNVVIDEQYVDKIMKPKTNGNKNYNKYIL